jgi:hypothetical protein
MSQQYQTSLVRPVFSLYGRHELAPEADLLYVPAIHP